MKFTPALLALSLAVIAGCAPSQPSSRLQHTSSCQNQSPSPSDCLPLPLVAMSDAARFLIAQRARHNGNFSLASDGSLSLALEGNNPFLKQLALFDSLAGGNFDRSELLLQTLSTDQAPQPVSDQGSSTFLAFSDSLYQLLQAAKNPSLPLPDTTDSPDELGVLLLDPIKVATLIARGDQEAARTALAAPVAQPQRGTSPRYAQIRQNTLRFISLRLDALAIAASSDPQQIAQIAQQINELDNTLPVQNWIPEALADLYLRAGDTQKARNVWVDQLDRFATQTPDNIQGLEALATLDDAIKTGKPVTLPNAQQLGHQMIAGTLVMAAIGHLSIDLGIAMVLAQMALDFDPDSGNTRVAAALILRSYGRPDLALNLLQRTPLNTRGTFFDVIQRRSSSASWHRSLVLFNTIDQKIALVEQTPPSQTANNVTTDTILKDLDQLTQTPGVSIAAYHKIAGFLASQDRWLEAIDASTQAIEQLKHYGIRSWVLLFRRGSYYERAGLWAYAERDFLDALELTPTNPDLLNYLAYTWADQNIHLEQSLRMLQEALQANPNSGAITDSLGWAYYRADRFEEAVSLLERASELMSGSAVINEHLGDAYWRVGREREARYQWRHGLETVDNEPDRQRLLHKFANGLNPL